MSDNLVGKTIAAAVLDWDDERLVLSFEGGTEVAIVAVWHGDQTAKLAVTYGERTEAA